MWKIFLTSFLNSFVNETINGKVGEELFKGKAIVTENGENGTKIKLKLGSVTEYEITVKKVKLKYEWMEGK